MEQEKRLETFIRHLNYSDDFRFVEINYPPLEPERKSEYYDELRGRNDARYEFDLDD